MFRRTSASSYIPNLTPFEVNENSQDFNGTLISVCKSISTLFKLENMIWAFSKSSCLSYDKWQIIISIEQETHISFKEITLYTAEMCSSHTPWNSPVRYTFNFSLCLQGKRFPRSHLKNIKHYKPQVCASEKSSIVSSINSRRSNLALIAYFQNKFLTCSVAWSIFHGKTTAFKRWL